MDRLAHSKYVPRHNTPLGDAVEMAAKDMVLRPEPRKVLFAFTDGEANNVPHAKFACELAEKHGIKVCVIGIIPGYALQAHHRAVSCFNVSQLSTVTMQELVKVMGLVGAA